MLIRLVVQAVIDKVLCTSWCLSIRGCDPICLELTGSSAMALTGSTVEFWVYLADCCAGVVVTGCQLLQ